MRSFLRWVRGAGPDIGRKRRELEYARSRRETTAAAVAERRRSSRELETEAKTEVLEELRNMGFTEVAEKVGKRLELSERLQDHRDDERSRESELLQGIFGTGRRPVDGRR